MRTYSIRPDPKLLAWFTLHIFSTRKQMNAYIKTWRKRQSLNPMELNGTAGLVTSRGVREWPAERSGSWSSNHWATMFLNDVDLRRNRQEIVAHEALHCALAHERHLQRYVMDYGSGDDIEDEERLCYLHGRIVAGIYSALAKERAS